VALSRDELRALLRSVAETKDEEIDCGACLDGMSEFAERELAGLPLGDAQRKVEEHLKLCGECREEYETLLRALRSIGSGEP